MSATPRLQQLTLDVTTACDARCAYCHWWRAPAVTPPLEALLQAAGEAVELGTRVIRLSGGEPFLRDDLPELLSAQHRLGVITMVCSAGPAARSRILPALDAGLDLLSISLDTTDPARFQRLRGYPLQPVLERLEALAPLRAERRFELVLSTVLTRISLPELPALLALAARHDLLLSVTPFHDGGKAARDKGMAALAFGPVDNPFEWGPVCLGYPQGPQVAPLRARLQGSMSGG